MPSRISVIIPTYNRLGYLLEALESVRQQSRPADEVLIVDDGSTDGTEEAMRGLAPPFRYLRQPNSGPAAARNLGLREAKGDWIAFLDSDDLWLPDKLAGQIAFLEQNPRLEFLFAHMANFGPDGDTALPEILDPTVNRYCQQYGTDLRDFIGCLFRVNPVPTPSVILKRSALSRIGFFREDLRCGEDYDWWIRWALHARCGFLDRVVMKRRLHKSNIVNDRKLMLKANVDILSRLAAEPIGLSESQKHELDQSLQFQRYRLASEYFKLREYGLAYAHFRLISLRHSTRVPKSRWACKAVISFIRK